MKRENLKGSSAEEKRKERKWILQGEKMPERSSRS